MSNNANVLMSEDDAHHFFSQLSLNFTKKDDSFSRPVSIKEYSGENDCRLLVRARGLGRSISMDMEEIKACRDLGLSLPREWTVDISSGTESGCGESSPVSNCSISSPGDDPREIKARLKVWAQVVALASSSSSSSLPRS